MIFFNARRWANEKYLPVLDKVKNVQINRSQVEPKSENSFYQPDLVEALAFVRADRQTDRAIKLN